MCDIRHEDEDVDVVGTDEVEIDDGKAGGEVDRVGGFSPGSRQSPACSQVSEATDVGRCLPSRDDLVGVSTDGISGEGRGARVGLTSICGGDTEPLVRGEERESEELVLELGWPMNDWLLWAEIGMGDVTFRKQNGHSDVGE